MYRSLLRQKAKSEFLCYTYCPDGRVNGLIDPISCTTNNTDLIKKSIPTCSQPFDASLNVLVNIGRQFCIGMQD